MILNICTSTTKWAITVHHILTLAPKKGQWVMGK